MRSERTWIHRNAVLINLAARPDRLSHAQAHLTAMGLDFSLHSTSKPLDRGTYGNEGTRGCAEAHLKILENAVTRGNEPVLIMEDDLMPCRSFSSRCREYHQLIAPLIDAVDIVYYYNQSAVGSIIGSEHVSVLRRPTIGTHFYVAIDPEKILSACDRSTPIDILYHDAVKSGKLAAVSPSHQLVSQDIRLGSDIDGNQTILRDKTWFFNRVYADGPVK